MLAGAPNTGCTILYLRNSKIEKHRIEPALLTTEQLLIKMQRGAVMGVRNDGQT